jgi:hypothetical protein
VGGRRERVKAKGGEPENKPCNLLKLKERITISTKINFKKTPWPESMGELYRPSGRRLSAKLVPTFAGRGCDVVSVTDAYGRVLGFLDRSRLLFLSSSSSVVLTRLSGPRSRPTTFFFW